MGKGKADEINQKLLSKLPSNVGEYLEGKEQFYSGIFHYFFWKYYFENWNPSYDDIMQCFRTLKPKDGKEYPFCLSGVGNGKINFFVKSMILFADEEVFWNRVSYGFLKNNKELFLKYLSQNEDLGTNPKRLIQTYRKEYSWEKALPKFFDPNITMQKRERSIPIIERNLKYIFALKNKNKLYYKDHSGVSRGGGSMIFGLVAKGVEVPTKLFDEILNKKNFLLESSEFLSLLTEELREHSFDNDIYKIVGAPVEKKRIRRFVEKIESKKTLNLAIRVSKMG